MSLTTTIAVQDGLTAAVNLAAGVAANVTPGNLVTITPQVSTGMLSWTVVINSDYGPLNQTTQTFTGPLFSFSLPMPQQPCKLLITSEATDGNNFYQTQNTLYNYPRTGVTVHSVAYVQQANSNLLACNCACDGLQPVAGDTILLVGQSNLAQNGPYTVGALTANLAALTRTPDYFTGALLKNPQIFEVASGGTTFGNSTWKVTQPTANSTTGQAQFTVDTTAVQLMPRVQKGTFANVATSNANALGLFVLSNTTTVLVTSNLAANGWVYVTSQVASNSTVANSGFITISGSGNATGYFLLTNW